MTDDRAASWDQSYVGGRPPWDIGRPQPAFEALADAGDIVAPVLDCGCGTGEQALMVAARGLEVVGVDIAPTAIRRAQAKARERGLAASPSGGPDGDGGRGRADDRARVPGAEFLVADALDLGRLGRRFATVLDSGVFHTFDDDDRVRYVESLASVVMAGGVVHLLCFSELTPGTNGPRRVSQHELRAAFEDGWRVEQISAGQFAVRDGWPGDEPQAWLARIAREVA